MSYIHGDWLAICDRCGFQKNASQLRKEYTGLRVCRYECWDPKHPQERVRGVPDRQNVPWVRPEPEPVFVFNYYRREDGTIIYREDGRPLTRES